MVYSYLLDLYQVLDKRKKDIEFQISQLSNDPEKLQYQKGRLTSINEFKAFLTTHYHAKLPRRIQKQRE
ncbi:MAG: hypothetical protein GQ542_19975 [Desulforhopalus sp.]|jgi:hypothetical protein|nr:hypothetical protein [Desulforhopalus sp.]